MNFTSLIPNELSSVVSYEKYILLLFNFVWLALFSKQDPKYYEKTYGYESTGGVLIGDRSFSNNSIAWLENTFNDDSYKVVLTEYKTRNYYKLRSTNNSSVHRNDDDSLSPIVHSCVVGYNKKNDVDNNEQHAELILLPDKEVAIVTWEMVDRVASYLRLTTIRFPGCDRISRMNVSDAVYVKDVESDDKLLRSSKNFRVDGMVKSIVRNSDDGYEIVTSGYRGCENKLCQIILDKKGNRVKNPAGTSKNKALNLTAYRPDAIVTSLTDVAAGTNEKSYLLVENIFPLVNSWQIHKVTPGKHRLISTIKGEGTRSSAVQAIGRNASIVCTKDVYAVHCVTFGAAATLSDKSIEPKTYKPKDPMSLEAVYNMPKGGFAMLFSTDTASDANHNNKASTRDIEGASRSKGASFLQFDGEGKLKKSTRLNLPEHECDKTLWSVFGGGDDDEVCVNAARLSYSNEKSKSRVVDSMSIATTCFQSGGSY